AMQIAISFNKLKELKGEDFLDINVFKKKMVINNRQIFEEKELEEALERMNKKIKPNSLEFRNHIERIIEIALKKKKIIKNSNQQIIEETEILELINKFFKVEKLY